MVDKNVQSAQERVARRLATVKVVVDLLNHELDVAKADKAISLERDRLDAIVTTLEDFIGDVEGTLAGGEERRVTETARATVNRVT